MQPGPPPAMILAHNNDGLQEWQQSVLVEDIPSHEIYTSLVGIKRRTSPIVEQQPVPSSHGATTSGAAIVENWTIGEPRQNIRAEFWQTTYMKSQEIQLSSISIDRSNKGFKLLSKMGWREQDGGLGKRRQGSMLPIQTVLKEGKLGLGAGKRKTARITHTHVRNKEETIVQDRKETKAERKRRRQLEQEEVSRKDKRIRMMLRTDIPDADEALYTQLI